MIRGRESPSEPTPRRRVHELAGGPPDRGGRNGGRGYGDPEDVLGAVVGPGGCVYTGDDDQLLKLTGPNSCRTPSGPEIRLSDDAPATPGAGSKVTFAVTFTGSVAPDGQPLEKGMPIRFEITQQKLVPAKADGTAKTVETAVFAGGDTVIAVATTEEGTAVESNLVEVHWVPGLDTDVPEPEPEPDARHRGRRDDLHRAADRRDDSSADRRRARDDHGSVAVLRGDDGLERHGFLRR